MKNTEIFPVNRILGAIGSGLIGSIVFFGANLLFGGSGETAQQVSFFGFWLFAIVSFFTSRKL